MEKARKLVVELSRRGAHDLEHSSTLEFSGLLKEQKPARVVAAVQ